MLKVTARAKINWSLDILGILDSGYHEMDMLMSNVTLADELLLSPADDLTISVPGYPLFETDDNLVMKAAKALRDTANVSTGANIILQKNIPHGAGMGGGSADAAAALIGLNHLWNTCVSQDTLFELAQKLGADVPFFLTGGFARIGGFGESIHPLPPLKTISLVILQPCKPQSTKDVFMLYDHMGSVRHPDTINAADALSGNDLAAFYKYAGNVLQQALEPSLPQITEAIAALDSLDAVYAAMTGSGSAVFGAFENMDNAAQAFRVLKKRWKKCWVCETSAQSITMEEVQ